MYKYITNRTILNKAGEETGRIQAMVKEGSDNVEGKYICAECKHEGQINQPFKRPLSVKCEKCGFLMRLPKLKGKKN